MRLPASGPCREPWGAIGRVNAAGREVWRVLRDSVPVPFGRDLHLMTLGSDCAVRTGLLTVPGADRLENLLVHGALQVLGQCTCPVSLWGFGSPAP